MKKAATTAEPAMKIRVYSKILLQCVERCTRISYDHDSFWMSSRVRFALAEKQLRLTVAAPPSWIDILLNCEVETAGPPILFECADLMNILRALRGEWIRIAATDTTAVLSDEQKRSYRVQIHPNASDYSEAPPVVGTRSVEVAAATLVEGIDSVKFALPKDLAHPQRCFVFLQFSPGWMEAYASEGHVLARRKLACPGATSEFQLGIPALDGNARNNFLKAILALESTEPLRITLGETHLFVESDDTLVCSALPAALPFNFAAAHATATFAPAACSINTEVFRKSLNAVCVLNRREKKNRDDDESLLFVRLQMSAPDPNRGDKTFLTLSASTSRFTADDEFEVFPTTTAEPFQCLLSPDWLKDALSAVPTDTVTLRVDEKDIFQPALIVSDDDEKSYDCIVSKMEER